MIVELIVSGTAGVLVGCLHSYVGETKFLPPLFSSDPRSTYMKRDVVQRVIRSVWHLPSVAWVMIGGTLLYAGTTGHDSLYLAVSAAATFGLSSALNLTATRSPHPGGLLLAVASIAAAIHPFVRHHT